jgi:anthranilate/para-aminobenzoate synthase component I
MHDIWTVLPLKGENRFVKYSQASKAYIYFKNSKLDVLTGKKIPYSSKELIKNLDQYSLKQTYRFPIVFHLFYELGHLLTEEFEKIKNDDILMIEIQYQNCTEIKLPEILRVPKFKPEIPPISFRKYDNSFQKCYEYLLKGECYQLNLTFPSFFSFKGNFRPNDFLVPLWKEKKNIGEYAHGTWLGPLNRFYLSNSPECLFQVKKNKKNFKLYSMPIKGSLKYNGSEELTESWNKLKNSKKDEGELFMITDMLRNDLSSVELPKARVIKKKSPLVVPGIIHQYSLLSVDLDYKVRLGKIIKSLFPGGSITGAPKKRVKELLFSLEKRSRGFYCGSTVILHESLLAASINIRSAEICFTNKLLKYSSGSGITLLSKSKDEFDELRLKEYSFMKLFEE